MKKTYIIPTLSITMVNVVNMISQSILSTAGAPDLGLGGNSSDAGVTAGNVKSYTNYNVWDDDWSE